MSQFDSELNKMIDELSALRSDCDRLRKQRDGLRPYLVHSPGCEMPLSCTCGLSAAIADCEANP